MIAFERANWIYIERIHTHTWCCSDTDIEQLAGLARTEITKAMKRKTKCESNVRTEQAYVCFFADATATPPPHTHNAVNPFVFAKNSFPIFY